ncbi:MAG: NAD-dependent epimerase/dehydratase family protein [bacterium]
MKHPAHVLRSKDAMPDKNLRSIERCLVTGATGFIGSHLALALVKQGVAVRALVRNISLPIVSKLSSSEVEIVRGDIMQPDTVKPALEGCDTVFHAAAVLGPANLDPAIYKAVNADAVTSMIQACRNAASVNRFVHVSSVGVLGDIPHGTRADEGTPPRPQDIYEITKLDGEERVLAAARDGFGAVIVRPGWVYGPGDTRTLKLFRMIARRKFMIIGKAQNKQHPVFIDDVVDGIILAAQTNNIEGRVYHLCGPDVPTVNDLCEIVAAAAGVTIFPFRPPLWAVRTPAKLIGILWSLFGADPPIDHRKADFFILNRAYSIQRAKNELKWIPKMRFEDGIRSTIEWYKNHGML